MGAGRGRSRNSLKINELRIQQNLTERRRQELNQNTRKNKKQKTIKKVWTNPLPLVVSPCRR